LNGPIAQFFPKQFQQKKKSFFVQGSDTFCFPPESRKTGTDAPARCRESRAPAEAGARGRRSQLPPCRYHRLNLMLCAGRRHASVLAFLLCRRYPPLPLPLLKPERTPDFHEDAGWITWPSGLVPASAPPTLPSIFCFNPTLCAEALLPLCPYAVCPSTLASVSLALVCAQRQQRDVTRGGSTGCQQHATCGPSTASAHRTVCAKHKRGASARAGVPFQDLSSLVSCVSCVGSHDSSPLAARLFRHTSLPKPEARSRYTHRFYICVTNSSRYSMYALRPHDDIMSGDTDMEAHVYVGIDEA